MFFFIAGDEAVLVHNRNPLSCKWSSPDQFVGDRANSIEDVAPGRIVDVETPKYYASTPRGTVEGSSDILGDDYFIEVFSGPGRSKAPQVRNLMLLAPGKRAAVYAPDVSWGRRRDLEGMGVKVFTGGFDEVTDWIEAGT